jgi:predicted Zn-dependent protease
MSFAARYARVIADYKSSWWDKALNDLAVLLKEQENNPFLWELKGQIYFETARANLAKPAYEKALSLRPDSVLFRVNLAQTLLATQDNQDVAKAVIELKTAVTKEPDSYSYHLLAQAYDTLKEPGLARLSTAESQYWAGDYQSARQTAVWSQKFLDPQSTEFRRARDIVITTSSALGVDAVEDSTSRIRSPKGEKRQK